MTQAQKDAQILLNYEKLDSVYKFSNMSFKQFKSLYYFVNSCNKKTVGDTKTF
jgi:hypothetical protein